MEKDLFKIIFSWIILLFLLLPGTEVQAQQRVVISGVVTSKTDGEPLVGVTIAEKDKNNRIVSGVITDVNGEYAIRMVNPKNTLSFSFIGFIQQNINPKNRTKINVTLVENVSEIGQITVSANKMVNTGGLNIDQSRVATSIQSIETKDLGDASSSSLVDELQGRLSGVDIVANSGDPGSGMSIRIRGTSSLSSSSDPLIVINGIPYETEIDDSFDFSTADEEEYSSLIGVATEDIQSISVLKDAAATAQYGSRAANGVLLITTKRGATGKARFSYSYVGSMAIQPKGFSMLNGYNYCTVIMEEALAGYRDLLDDMSQLEYDPDYEYYNYYNKNTDWIDEITRVGFVNTHNFSVSGGGEKAKYRISSTVKKNKGTTVGTGSKLFTARAVLDYDVSNKIHISTELAFSHGTVDKSKSGLRSMALKKMPNMTIYEIDDLGNYTDNYYTPIDAFQGDGDSYYNPVAMANLYKWKVRNNRISPVFNFTYNPIKNLSYKMALSYDVNNNKTTKFLPEEAMGLEWTDGSANQSYLGDSEFSVLMTNNYITWKKNLEKHKILLQGKFQTYDKKSRSYAVKSSNTPSDELSSPIIDSRIESSSDNSLSSSDSEYRYIAANFIFNYSYMDKYVLSGGIRCEGNSRFGANYRYGYFPSIAGRWNLDKEEFLKYSSFIDELALKGSFGVNGVSPNFNYGSYSVYSSSTTKYIDVTPVYPSNIELSNLKWETVTQKNLGFSLVMFKNRINIDGEVYVKSTKDVLNKSVSIPTTSGFSSLKYMNAGDIDNKGFEISVYTTPIKKKNFQLQFNFNIARNINKIKKIVDGMDIEDGNCLTTGSGGYLKRIQEGNPIGSFYGYKFKGVYSTEDDLYAKDADGNIITDLDGEAKNMKFNNSYSFCAGDSKFEDINHDGNINKMDVIYLGNANPMFYGGFGTTAKYKKLSFTVFCNFRYHQKLINLARMSTETLDGLDNQNTSVLRRWQYSGQITDVPRAYYGSNVNGLASDRWLEDGSFLRIKYITLKYSLPKSIANKFSLGSAKAYITAQNLFTFTKYLGPDPETGNSSSWKKLGYDSNQTPRSKQITLGLSLTFK